MIIINTHVSSLIFAKVIFIVHPVHSSLVYSINMIRVVIKNLDINTPIIIRLFIMTKRTRGLSKLFAQVYKTTNYCLLNFLLNEQTEQINIPQKVNA